MLSTKTKIEGSFQATLLKNAALFYIGQNSILNVPSCKIWILKSERKQWFTTQVPLLEVFNKHSWYYFTTGSRAIPLSKERMTMPSTNWIRIDQFFQKVIRFEGLRWKWIFHTQYLRSSNTVDQFNWSRFYFSFALMKSITFWQWKIWCPFSSFKCCQLFVTSCVPDTKQTSNCVVHSQFLSCRCDNSLSRANFVIIVCFSLWIKIDWFCKQNNKYWNK